MIGVLWRWVRGRITSVKNRISILLECRPHAEELRLETFDYRAAA